MMEASRLINRPVKTFEISRKNTLFCTTLSLCFCLGVLEIKLLQENFGLKIAIFLLVVRNRQQ